MLAYKFPSDFGHNLSDVIAVLHGEKGQKEIVVLPQASDIDEYVYDIFVAGLSNERCGALSPNLPIDGIVTMFYNDWEDDVWDVRYEEYQDVTWADYTDLQEFTFDVIQSEPEQP